MHLLNVHTQRLEEFVTFKDMQDTAVALIQAGFQKISYPCEKAIADHLHYVWIDTCCINKSSSAELSESTNSMFRWYVEAEVYYAYLSDLGGLFNPRGLRQSRWFTRGWTLQELLAPRKVLFYSEDWTHLGSKSSLVTSLSEATQIDRDVLLDPGKLRKKPIACRMSWPAGRETTRIEDIAYSLLGIFNVHMALLYGEGTNAFLRLQEEIMKISTDSSLFTWNILHRQEYNEANILGGCR
ncbi:hypothetical protein B0J14DRAFT_614619 [Halenospora varia]|nr:hypothetical protein B0J14DRAFT_614619 [Halenospora varia]